MINCSRFRCFCVLVVGAIFFFLLVIHNSFGYSSSLSMEPDSSAVHRKLMTDSSMLNGTLEYSSSQEDSSQVSDFVYNPSHDVLVFLHMQKTSGSVFGRHLVHDAVGFPAACYRIRGRKRSNCTASDGSQWLFSRYSTGWSCGVHADWTELHACVPRALNKIEGVRRKRRSVDFIFLYYQWIVVYFVVDMYLSDCVPSVFLCVYLMCDVYFPCIFRFWCDLDGTLVSSHVIQVDLKPMNISLSPTWKKATIQKNWRSVVDMAVLRKSVQWEKEEEIGCAKYIEDEKCFSSAYDTLVQCLTDFLTSLLAME